MAQHQQKRRRESRPTREDYSKRTRAREAAYNREPKKAEDEGFYVSGFRRSPPNERESEEPKEREEELSHHEEEEEPEKPDYVYENADGDEQSDDGHDDENKKQGRVCLRSADEVEREIRDLRRSVAIRNKRRRRKTSTSSSDSEQFLRTFA